MKELGLGFVECGDESLVVKNWGSDWKDEDLGFSLFDMISLV